LSLIKGIPLKTFAPYIAVFALGFIVFFLGWHLGKNDLRSQIASAPIIRSDTTSTQKTDTLPTVVIPTVRGKTIKRPPVNVDSLNGVIASLVALRGQEQLISELAEPFFVDTTLQSVNHDSTVYVSARLQFVADCINKRVDFLTFAPIVRTPIQTITQTKVVFEKESFVKMAIGYAVTGLTVYGLVRKDAGLTAIGAGLIIVRIIIP